MAINSMPLVSVVVTTYNRRELLMKTIDSILNQTYKNFELIVVDNYSDYDFLSYLKSFNDERIRSFQNKNEGIIAVNRNFGIKKAKGEYIAFCDDDDIWFPKKLELQLKTMLTTKTQMSCTDGLIGKGVYDSTKKYKINMRKYNLPKIRKKLVSF